jgi:uncharacterized membrane protein YphA (DoxX/SURF4 family)
MGIYADTRNYFGEAWQAWNRFWFASVDPATLCLIRLLAGGMLFYTHLIWSLDLQAFIGPEGWLPVEFIRSIQSFQGTPQWSVWSVFFWIKQPWLLWCVHIFVLVVFFCLMIGLFSRTMAVLAFLFAVSYAHRVTPGAFFGLDKANCMLALYLMLGPCGARYSLDSLRRARRGITTPVAPSTAANLAIRLLQIHLCIVYFFSGLAKYTGENWDVGTAVWWALANYEYQSIDMTWLAGHPVLIALASHVTVFWELTYGALVWNRFTRPLVLWMAVFVHLGIALFMGMITFGVAMIIANLSFLSPKTVRAWFDPVAGRFARLLGAGK